MHPTTPIARRGIRFKSIVRILTAVLILNQLLASSASSPSKAQTTESFGTPGNLVQETSPEAFGYGDVVIRTKTTSGTLLPGACYSGRQSAAGGTYIYVFACDAWDDVNDGVTNVLNVKQGTWEFAVSFLPEGYLYAMSQTGIRVVDGGVKSLSFALQCCSSKVVIRTKTGEGDYIRFACYYIREGSSTGKIVAAGCDDYDGKPDGKVIVSGPYVPPGVTRTWFIEQAYIPGGFVTAKTKSISMTNQKAVTANFVNAIVSLSPTCTFASTSVTSGASLAYTCKGFFSYQDLTPLWDGEEAGWGYCDVQGRCSGYVWVPQDVGGNHSVIIASVSHATSARTIKVIPSLYIYPSQGKGGSLANISVQGFKSGEKVTFRQQGSSNVLAGPITVESDGFGFSPLIIPDGPTATLTFYGEGNMGSTAKITYQRTGPGPTATPTVTASATKTATATRTATATASPTLTPSPSPTLTSVPTETATNTEVPVATESPTVVETETSVPTLTPTETPV